MVFEIQVLYDTAIIILQRLRRLFQKCVVRTKFDIHVFIFKSRVFKTFINYINGTPRIVES
jgi:hypothetical protein